MELQEQLTACKAELDHYKKAIEQSEAERLALDQMYVELLKDQVKVRKEAFLLNKTINDLRNEITELTKQKQDLEEFKQATESINL